MVVTVQPNFRSWRQPTAAAPPSLPRRIPPRAPELQLLHRWLDNWMGLGLIVVGIERQGLRVSLSHIGEDGWRATFMGDNPMLAPSDLRWRRPGASGTSRRRSTGRGNPDVTAA